MASDSDLFDPALQYNFGVVFIPVLGTRSEDTVETSFSGADDVQVESFDFSF